MRLARQSSPRLRGTASAAVPVWLLALVLSLISLACGWTTLPIANQPGDQSAPALQSLDSGLDKLQSYRLSLKLRFTGRPEGSAQDQTVLIDTLEEKAIVNQQPVRHFLFLASGAPDLPGAFEYYQIGEQGYTLSSAQGSDPTCQLVNSPAAGEQSAEQPFQAGSGFELLPQMAVHSLSSAQRVAQGETVNGILSDRYRLETITSADGLNQVEGDLWIAQASGVVVRFSGSLQGQVAINILNGSGLLGWEYNLADINALNALPVPDQCLSLNSLAVPLPENAQNVLQSSTQLTFTSPSPLADLITFYQTRLPAEGWSIDQEGGSNTLFSLSASRSNQSIQITVGPETGGQTQVSIEANAGQQ